MHWRRKWQPTPGFLPGESQGQGSLVGCRLWGHTESDTTEVMQQQQPLLLTHIRVREDLLSVSDAFGPWLWTAFLKAFLAMFLPVIMWLPWGELQDRKWWSGSGQESQGAKLGLTVLFWMSPHFGKYFITIPLTLVNQTRVWERCWRYFKVFCPILVCWGSITKYHRLDGLNNRHLFSYSPEGRKVYDQGVGRVGSFWGLSSACRWLSSSCVFTRASFCAQ